MTYYMIPNWDRLRPLMYSSKLPKEAKEEFYRQMAATTRVAFNIVIEQDNYDLRRHVNLGTIACTYNRNPLQTNFSSRCHGI